MIMITRKRLGELADRLSEAVTHGAGITVADIADELHAASVEPESTTQLLSGVVDARELDDSFIGYRMGVNLSSAPDGYEILAIASVEPITYQGLPGARLTFAEYPGHHYDARGGISVRAPISVQRKPYVPAAHYAAGGARMADAIERLDDALNDVKIDLDAHRAALVAAGWLDVNGEPR